MTPAHPPIGGHHPGVRDLLAEHRLAAWASVPAAPAGLDRPAGLSAELARLALASLLTRPRADRRQGQTR